MACLPVALKITCSSLSITPSMYASLPQPSIFERIFSMSSSATLSLASLLSRTAIAASTHEYGSSTTITYNSIL